MPSTVYGFNLPQQKVPELRHDEVKPVDSPQTALSAIVPAHYAKSREREAITASEISFIFKIIKI